MQVASLTRNEMVDIIKKDSNESINQDILLLCDILKNDNLSSEEIVDVSMKISSRNIRKIIISKIDFNQFVAKSTVCCGLDSAMYDLKKSYSDQFGFYVWNEDELYTMQQWMRTVEPLGTYYLGGVVDYHF